LKLNTEQQQVVDHDGHSLVVACPGSGKTRVIVVKIGHILASKPRARVCAVTFTRDAANELKSRLVKDIGSETVNKRTRVGTFHSLAIKQLRARGHIGKIAAPAEQVIYLMRAIKSLEEPIAYEDAVQIIETVKSSRTTVPEADHPLYLAYASILSRSGVEDLYDVLRKSLALMQQGVVEPYPVEYMLVDEFQDTDEIQLAWVLEHAKAGTKVTVVGDDDQSVYSFRRALGYQGMDRFRLATDATLITLGTNYRCRSEILSSAKSLIMFNQERIDKSLVADRGTGGSVTAMRCPDRIAEADRVVDEVMKHVVPLTTVPGFQYTTPPGKWAVLARNRRTIDAVEEALRESGIKYLRPPSESIWNRPPFIYFIGILKSIQTGAADGVINMLHWMGVSHEHINLITHHYEGDMWKLMDGHPLPCGELPAEVAKIVKTFATTSLGWRRMTKKGNYPLVITGVREWFSDRIKEDDLKALFNRIATSVENMSGTLAQRANSLTLPPPCNESNDAPSGVSLMTMHGSKGLEFDYVWIVAAESGVVPSPKNPVYDEERRLFYVAMTRARDHLFMSSRITESASPFIDESGHAPR